MVVVVVRWVLCERKRSQRSSCRWMVASGNGSSVESKEIRSTYGGKNINSEYICVGWLQSVRVREQTRHNPREERERNVAERRHAREKRGARATDSRVVAGSKNGVVRPTGRQKCKI